MPIAITPQDLTNVAAEFKSVAPDTISLFIDGARPFVDEGYWGSTAKLGIILMAAHQLAELGLGSTTSAGASANGYVTQEKVGELSRSYQPVQVGDSLVAQTLGTTPYGRQFLRLRARLTTTPLVT